MPNATTTTRPTDKELAKLLRGGAIAYDLLIDTSDTGQPVKSWTKIATGMREAADALEAVQEPFEAKVERAAMVLITDENIPLAVASLDYVTRKQLMRAALRAAGYGEG